MPKLLKVRVKVLKLVGQDVSVSNEVKIISPEALLHLYVVVTEAIFTGYFMTLREVIYTLELVESLIEERLTRAG